MKVKIYILLLCIACTTVTQAQLKTENFAGVDYQNGKIKDGDISGSHKRVDAFVNFPITVSANNFVGGRINYMYNDFKNINESFDHSLTGINTNIFWRKTLSDKHRLMLSVDIGLYSDFKDIDGDDFRFRLVGIYNIKHSDRLTSGFGVAYAKQFTAHQISPFAQIEYKINDKLLLSGLLPIMPKLTYTINDRFSWTNELSGSVESYRLSEKLHNSSVIEISGWHGMSSLNFTAGKHHRFSLGLGYSIKQRMRYFENEESNSWKLFTFDLSDKNKPTAEINVRGVRGMIGYNLIL